MSVVPESWEVEEGGGHSHFWICGEFEARSTWPHIKGGKKPKTKSWSLAFLVLVVSPGFIPVWYKTDG